MKLKYSKEKLRKIAEEYKIADIYFFGSRVEGFERKDSDFDIAVRFINGLPKNKMKVYGNLFSDLTGCFKVKIDLVFIEEVLPHFQFKIINEGELLYFKDFIKTADFQERLALYYMDYKYFIDEFYQGILETSAKI